MAYTRKCSASQINLYNKCPRSWWYKYKEKIKEPQSEALIKGSFTHSVIERFYKLNIRQCTITKGNYTTEFHVYATKIFNEVLVEDRCVFGKPCKSFKDELRDICSDDFEYAKEISDARKIIRNYINFFIVQFEQYLDAVGNIPQAWYSLKPKFSELDLSFENFIGYADSVIENNDGLYIVDYKTSKIYKTGHNEDYRLQVNLYAYAYYKLFGIIPSVGIINFIRYGRECVYEIDKDNVITDMENVISDFFEKTASDNIDDYPMNTKHIFCTCSLSKHADKTWCYYKTWCNKEIENGNAVIL